MGRPGISAILKSHMFCVCGVVSMSSRDSEVCLASNDVQCDALKF